MTLLVTVLAAIAATIVWYCKLPDGKMRLGTLCLIYWGASIMWLADAIAEYIKIGAEYFSPSVSELLNDTFLGLSAVALGLVIWLITLFVSDPEGKLRTALLKTVKNELC